MAENPAVYRPRNPTLSQYYQCVEDHFETLEQVHDERFSRQYGFFRPYVKRVIYRYLDCGILHNGFARVKCGDCGHEFLLAFSCKRRHFCPSCHQKRVVEFGEWLCEDVLKGVPHRNWWQCTRLGAIRDSMCSAAQGYSPVMNMQWRTLPNTLFAPLSRRKE